MFLPFVVALAVSLAITPLVRALARRLGFIAPPKKDRWHRQPTALLGGIAVFLATAAGAAWWWPLPAPLVVLALASIGVFVTGLVDDVVTLRPATKLALQIAAASAAVWGGVRLEWTGSLTADTLLSIFWFIGVTNALNLVDNMDGACAGVGAIAAGVVAAIGLIAPSGVEPHSMWAAALCGALVGFLFYNFHPASIFLGDSGSLFIGFLLAGVTAAAEGAARGTGFPLVALPVLVLAVPIFDTTLVTVARKLSGRSASQGGTDHTAHRLVRLGFTEPRAVVFLYAVSMMSGVAALALVQGSSGWEILVIGLSVGLTLLAVALLAVRVYGNDFFVLVEGRYRAGLVDFLLRHHIFELQLDLVLIAGAYYTANRLRFGAGQWALFFPGFLQSLPVVIACHIVCLLAVGVYGRVWRYFGITDLVPLVKGVGLGSLLSVLLLVYLYRLENVSRGALVTHAVLLTMLLAGSRLFFRLLPEMGGGAAGRAQSALVYGAGDAGELLVRELGNNRQYGFRLVGFIDDDPRKAGKRVRGLPVLGGKAALRAILDSGGAQAVIVSSDRLTPDTVDVVRAECLAAGVPLLRFRCLLEELVPAAAVRPVADIERAPR